MTDETAYERFWERLLPAYPISQGAFRLPIATELTTLPDLDLEAVSDELARILDDLLRNHGSLTDAATRLRQAGEPDLIPLLTEELTGVVRFDCVWQPDSGTVKVLEVNCDYPDGLILHDRTFGALSDTPTTLHEDLLIGLFDPDETVMVTHSPEAVFRDGYHAEYEALAKRPGHATLNTELSTGDPHTTIRRCLETSKLTAPMRAWLTTHRPRLVNTLGLRSLGYKDLLQTLDHPFVPETFPLTVDTAPRCLAEPARWVIKPVDGCEGFGIRIGRHESPEAWQQAVAAAAASDGHIAQEYVSLPRTTVRMYENGGITDKAVYFDLCPHFFVRDGRITGRGHTLVRYSENPVVNVTQGGGIGYYIP